MKTVFVLRVTWDYNTNMSLQVFVDRARAVEVALEVFEGRFADTIGDADIRADVRERIMSGVCQETNYDGCLELSTCDVIE